MDINGTTFDSDGVYYKVTYTSNRPNNSQMTYNFTIAVSILEAPLGLALADWVGLLGTVTINGVSVNYRVKSAGETWLATPGNSRTRTVSVTCPSTVGSAAQAVRFRVTSDGVYYSPRGPMDNSGYTVQSLPLANTAATAPTSVSVSPSVSEGNATLVWSGAAGGANNAITAYEIQQSDSANGTTWGDWEAHAIVNSTAASGNRSVAPPPTRGHFRRYRIRTRGVLGASWYSPWSANSNTLRRNTIPTAPTTFTASPAVYIGSQVTLSWSGAAAGTSPIREYNIQQSISTDRQATWTSWQTAATVTSSAASGSTTVNASAVGGTFTRCRISVTDTLGAVSGFTQSNAVLRNSPPLAPLVEAPRAGGVTYNRRPMVLIQTQPEPDGHNQAVWVRSNGVWRNSVDDAACFTTPGESAASVRTVFTEPDELPFGAHSIEVNLRDSLSTGAAVSRSFTIEPSPFEEITADETPVRAAHITVLRAAVNNVRNYYGMAAFAWHEAIIPGRTQILNWTYHILELRRAIDEVIAAVNHFGADIPSPQWLPIEPGRPRAAVMEQLHTMIPNL